MWFNESVFYQIYTLNFCGAPRDNDGIVEHRILRLNDFMDYFEDLGINAIYFNPVFSSDHHGYDTRDYCKIDERLGTNEDFIEICKNLHDRGMRVVLDGVFNHVGRGFFAFQDVYKRQIEKIVNIKIGLELILTAIHLIMMVFIMRDGKDIMN